MDNSSTPKNAGYTNSAASTDTKDVADALHTTDRTSPHDVVGQGIGAAKIGDIISGYPASTSLGTGTYVTSVVPNASSGNFIFNFADPYNRVVLGVPDVSIYIGSSISAANQWPNGSFGMGNMPIYVSNDWGLSDNVKIVTRVVVRNNSGSDATVFVVVRLRILTNATPVLTGYTTASTGQ